MGSSLRIVGAPRGRPISGHAAVRQVPFATARALTRTAKSAQREASSHFARVLDEPRRFTLTSPKINPARKTMLTARVFVKDDIAKGAAPAKYLRALEFGGQRRAKAFEKSLILAGILEPGEFAIPADGGSIDLRGNGAVGGIYTRMLSYLKASRDPGQNRTDASMKRRSRRGRRPTTYWRQGDFIWERTSARIARPLLVIVKGAPTYQPMLGFSDLVERVALAEMRWWWEDSMRQALRSAR